ncbi:thiamine ABC transporter substrate-binding protein [Nocardioides caeni]|uniref:Thiamine ABC transporter substrate-binding protein n=1 Tax=Nocardioides caeni TaxID=574700 RepID=A0A4S8NAW5_9ACTN|nr:thiamine ABC transporter substrate-binding protein [Nocardioides caeni]
MTGLAAASLVLTASGCSLIGGDDGDEKADATVTLITHESFALPDELVAAFEETSGYELEIVKLDDAGALTNELVHTKDNPLGDVVFGVDNTFATRALDEDVFASYAADLPRGAEEFVLPGDADQRLTPVDTGNVCVNVDRVWFEENEIEPPATLDDLTDERYRDLLVVPAASTSSPGMAFLLATVGRYGDDWTGYWEDLMANGAKVVAGWSDAYYTDFTYSRGDRPIVVSYDSSPAFTPTEDGSASVTRSFVDGCFEQVEYAGVLAGDDVNTEGAEAVVDWLLSPEVQAALPESMYVFPVDADVQLPAEWTEFVVRPTETVEVDPGEITANRQGWVEEWNEIISR